MKRGVKKRDYERLDDATIARVVLLLEQEKSITKKVACEILHISYNTKRLANIIGEHKDKIEFTKKRRAANKGTEFSELEIQELIVDYLNGTSITSIGNNLYRSIHSVKQRIKELCLPERTKTSTYQNPELIPEDSVSENFDIGELVWSAKYNAVAEIRAIYDDGTIGMVFSLWVFGKHNEFAYQPWWELGKLEAIKQFNLTADKFVKTEKPTFSYRIE